MYSSLERVDIVLKDDNGTTVHAQTDHRSAEQVAAAPEISILFAIARVLNARRNAPRRLRVAYFARCEPPAFLKQVLAALGAELFVDQQHRALNGRPAPVDPLLNEQLAALAERTRIAHGLGDDFASVERFARSVGATPPPEEDEAAHWTRIFELAASAGRVLARGSSARWRIEEKKELVPFVFRVELPNDSFELDLMAASKRAVSGSPEPLLEMLASATKRLASLN